MYNVLEVYSNYKEFNKATEAELGEPIWSDENVKEIREQIGCTDFEIWDVEKESGALIVCGNGVFDWEFCRDGSICVYEYPYIERLELV